MSGSIAPGRPLVRMLVFDWDGTLSDSLHRIAVCLQLAAADTGLPVPELAAARDIVGLGMREALQRLFPGVDESVLHALRDRYGHHFIREDSAPSPLFPGVMSTLEQLRARGFVLAVATGKSRRGLDRSLRGLGLLEFFHSTRCADETASKPDPAMLVSLLREQQLAPAEALMVGDTTFDMAMAHALGMPRLAVGYGAHSRDRLLDYAPLACLDDFRHIHGHV